MAPVRAKVAGTSPRERGGSGAQGDEVWGRVVGGVNGVCVLTVCVCVLGVCVCVDSVCVC